MPRLVISFVLFVAVVLVSACSTSRYSMKHDKGPSGDFDASEVPDAKPVWEPLSRKGNHSPYVVRGETYHLLDEVAGYRDEGIASWYGMKFHGELTSNGEVYNMYAMSAAHKTLPLPAYLKVTNLENDLSIVVRVNDRGPFHDDRIIDLSYAAAKKLGFDKQGTARVRLEAITPGVPESLGQTQAKADGKQARDKKDRLSNYIQVGAFSNKSSAENLVSKLSALQIEYPVFIGVSQDGAVYRVRIGPIDSSDAANKLSSLIQENDIARPVVLSRPVLAEGS